MFIRILSYMTLSLLLPFMGCGKKKAVDGDDRHRKASVVIRGEMTGGAGGKVVLEEMEAREFIPLDTAVVDESDRFRISLDPSGTAFYVLRTGGTGYITLLVEPGEELEISGSYGETFPYSVKGSEGSGLLQELAVEHRRVLGELAAIARKNTEMASSPDFAGIKRELDLEFDSITDAFREYSLEFIYRNPQSLAILIALHNLYGEGLPVFRPDRDLDVYNFVDSALTANYPEFEAVGLLHARMEEVRRYTADSDRINRIRTGEIAPDFVSSQPDGSQMALSDLRGNYVLLSFWAGWSSLSREENRYLKIAAERYREEPFRILQVSLDDSREVWINAIQKDGLGDWYHVSDLNRWETPAAELYYLEKIPSNVLVDPGGRIVATDLFGKRIFDKLDLIFREK